MTDSIEIVEEADGVQMNLLAEALGKGKVPEPGAAAEYTEGEVGAVAADTAEVGVAVMLDFPVLSVGVDPYLMGRPCRVPLPKSSRRSASRARCVEPAEARQSSRRRARQAPPAPTGAPGDGPVAMP